MLKCSVCKKDIIEAEWSISFAPSTTPSDLSTHIHICEQCFTNENTKAECDINWWSHSLCEMRDVAKN
jgi:hypothetical protein